MLSTSTEGRLRGRKARWRIARGEPRPEANGDDSMRGGQLATTEGTPRARHIAAGGEPRLKGEWPGEKGNGMARARLNKAPTLTIFGAPHSDWGGCESVEVEGPRT